MDNSAVGGPGHPVLRFVMAYPDLSATQPLLSNAAEKPTTVPPPDAWQGPGYGSVGPFSGDLPYQPVAAPPYHGVHSQAAGSGASSGAHDHYHWDRGAQQRGTGLNYPLGTGGSGASDYGYAGGVAGGPGVGHWDQGADRSGDLGPYSVGETTRPAGRMLYIDGEEVFIPDDNPEPQLPQVTPGEGPPPNIQLPVPPRPNPAFQNPMPLNPVHPHPMLQPTSHIVPVVAAQPRVAIIASHPPPESHTYTSYKCTGEFYKNQIFISAVFLVCGVLCLNVFFIPCAVAACINAIKAAEANKNNRPEEAKRFHSRARCCNIAVVILGVVGVVLFNAVLISTITVLRDDNIYPHTGTTS